MNIEFVVEGTAIPQGSKTAMVRNGRAIMYDANSKLKAWRSAVTASALDALVDHGAIPREDAVIVQVQFFFERPKTVNRLNPNVKPDIDKLLRALFDGITDAGLWADDCQVIDVRAIKGYTVDTPRVIVSLKSCKNL